MAKNMKEKEIENCAINKKVSVLLEKARELSILCESEIGYVTFSSEGAMNEYASSSMKSIIARYKKKMKDDNQPALQEESNSQQSKESDEEMAEEDDDVVGQTAKNHTSKQFINLMNFAGKNVVGMKSEEIFLLEDGLVKGLLYSSDKKTQLLMEELEQSIMHKQQLLLSNQILHKQAQGLVPPVYSSTSLSGTDRHPGIGGGASYQPSTSYARPFSVTDSPETDGGSSLPSTNFASLALPPNTNFLASSSSAATGATNNGLDLSLRL